MSGHFWLDKRHRQTRIFFFLVRRIAENFFYAVKKKSPSPHFINYVKGMSVKREIEDINAMRDGVNALANIAEDLFDEDGDVICGGASPCPRHPRDPSRTQATPDNRRHLRVRQRSLVWSTQSTSKVSSTNSTRTSKTALRSAVTTRYLVSTLPKVPKAPRKQKK